jgi:hypothetical protein
MSADRRRYKKGDQYQVTERFTGHVLTMWKAPFTRGYEKVIPAGLKFVIVFDPPASGSAVAADAEPIPEWEDFLVAADDRTDPKYNGYYLSIPFEHVEKHCVRLFQGQEAKSSAPSAQFVPAGPAITGCRSQTQRIIGRKNSRPMSRVPGQWRATVTCRKVAGMEVASLLVAVLWALNRASSSFCRSAARPFLSAASKAFMVGP